MPCIEFNGWEDDWNGTTSGESVSNVILVLNELWREIQGWGKTMFLRSAFMQCSASILKVDSLTAISCSSSNFDWRSRRNDASACVYEFINFIITVDQLKQEGLYSKLITIFRFCLNSIFCFVFKRKYCIVSWRVKLNKQFYRSSIHILHAILCVKTNNQPICV